MGLELGGGSLRAAGGGGAVQERSQDSAPPELEAQRTSSPVTQTQAFPPKLVFLLTLNCKKVFGVWKENEAVFRIKLCNRPQELPGCP